MGRDLPNSTGLNARSAVALLGLLVVIAGVGLLFFFGYMVYQIVNSPEDVKIVQYIVEMTEIQGPILEGRFIIPMDNGANGPARPADFEVTMSPELKSIIFLFIGAFALIICINIVKIMIGAGTTMIKAAGPESGISITSGREHSESSDKGHLHYLRARQEERRSRNQEDHSGRNY